MHPSVEHIFAYFFHLVGAGLLTTSEDCRFLFDDDDAPLLVTSADGVEVVRIVGADLFRVEIRRREVVDGSALSLSLTAASAAAAAAASAFFLS